MPITTDCLNEQQRAAALDTEGAVLVTAGAGSGKTRLLTHRIAHLIQDLGVPAYNVLAITFTNKAAEEMKNRLYALVPEAADIWVSTFHSMCAKILRRHSAVIGYGSNFTIYSQDESERLIKQIVKDLHIEGDTIVKSAARGISSAKNDGLTPEQYRDRYLDYDEVELITDIYIEYERRLKANNAMDFDDLLLKTYELFSRSADILESYGRKFRYIHVDEFQDTNEIQYGLVRMLADETAGILDILPRILEYGSLREKGIGNPYSGDSAACEEPGLEAVSSDVPRMPAAPMNPDDVREFLPFPVLGEIESHPEFISRIFLVNHFYGLAVVKVFFLDETAGPCVRSIHIGRYIVYVEYAVPDDSVFIEQTISALDPEKFEAVTVDDFLLG